MKSLQQNYAALVRQPKEEIRSARIRAAVSANMHLLVLYWKMGRAILQSQEAEGWGVKIIGNLAKDLRAEFPDMKGISPRNLKYMRAFADAYPEFVQVPLAQREDQRVQQPAAQIKQERILQEHRAKSSAPIVQVPLAQITWYHITLSEICPAQLAIKLPGKNKNL